MNYDLTGAWQCLEIAPTEDKRSIKRAYAKKLKKTHPEDNPEGFKQLRNAYEALLHHLDNPESPPNHATDNSTSDGGAETEHALQSPENEPQTEKQKAMGLFKQWVEIINEQGPAEGVKALQQLYHTDDLINIDVAEYFDTALYEALINIESIDIQIQLITDILKLPEISSRIEADWRFSYLRSFLENRKHEYERQMALAKEHERQTIREQCQNLVTQLDILTRTQSDSKALECLNDHIQNNAFEDERVTHVFREQIANWLLAYDGDVWPLQLVEKLQFLLQLIKEKCPPKYENVTVYIEERNEAHRFLIHQQESSNPAQKNVVEWLYSNQTPKPNIGFRARLQVAKLLKQIDYSHPILWQYELKPHTQARAIIDHIEPTSIHSQEQLKRKIKTVFNYTFWVLLGLCALKIPLTMISDQEFLRQGTKTLLFDSILWPTAQTLVWASSLAGIMFIYYWLQQNVNPLLGVWRAYWKSTPKQIFFRSAMILTSGVSAILLHGTPIFGYALALGFILSVSFYSFKYVFGWVTASLISFCLVFAFVGQFYSLALASQLLLNFLVTHVGTLTFYAANQFTQKTPKQDNTLSDEVSDPLLYWSISATISVLSLCLLGLYLPTAPST